MWDNSVIARYEVTMKSLQFWDIKSYYELISHIMIVRYKVPIKSNKINVGIVRYEVTLCEI